MLTDERIKKMWYLYTMGYYSAITKSKIMPFAATWMDLEITTLNERERQISNDTTFVEYETIIEMSLFTKQK